MKKVAFYIESMVLGGAERALIDIVNTLDPQLFDVTIVSIFKESVYPTANTLDFSSHVNKNIHVKYLVDNSKQINYKMFNRLYSRISKSMLYSVLVREKYDIEVAFYEGLPTEFVAHSTNRQSKKLAWLHTDNHRLYQDKSEDYIEKWWQVYSRYDCVVGVSEYVEESFHRFFPDIKCISIYNGIDLEAVRRQSSEDCYLERKGVTAFLTVGRIVPIKGYDRLLEASKKLTEEGYDFSLLMIGDGSEKEALKQYVSTNGLDRIVAFLGNQENPFKFFKLCDVFVCSSIAEGFGLAMVEAMSCGIPVLTTSFPCAQEVLGLANADCIYENSTEGIYHMLKDALDNPQRLKDRSPQFIEQSEKFDIFKQVKKMQDLFLEEENRHE